MTLLHQTASSPDRGTALLPRLLALGRPIVMGVLNVTPDSFSDGGRFLDPLNAIEQARRMIGEGADILDIGAESSRPYEGAVAVPIEQELLRLRPVLPTVARLGVPVSIDTMKATVADWALAQGAAIVNDVWGLQRDEAMARVVGARRAPLVIMHNRATADPSIDIMADIGAFFARSLEIAREAGISRDNIVLDPGIGFGKTPEQSLIAIARLAELRAFGLPLLVGASRKRFIDKVSPAPPEERLGGSIAAHVMALAQGAAIIRAHDVAETVQALRVDLALDIDLIEASRTDKLAHTVGYDQVVEAASRAFCTRRYRLIEAAAGAVADAVLEKFQRVSAVRVTVHKPHAPIAATFADVGVTIVRRRADHG
jgi:dihydropteroate synthase